MLKILELSGLFVCLGGLIKIFSAWEDRRNCWVAVYWRGISTHSWQSLPNPLFYEDSIYCLPPFFVQHTHTHTHIHKDTQRTQGPTDWHTHINLLTPLVLCAHSSFLYWMNNLLISTSTMSFLFQNYSLVEAMICWLDAVRLSSSCETQVILIEMVWINKIHTNTTQRNKTLETIS